ncbi:MAG: hypothetical protein JWL60_2251 [Gemmatimonadetes bacterium]|nr:hypothetical protein [Gemmatimonadota bacterium]
MRFPRKLALGFGAVAASLLLAAVLVPYLFRDRIVARIRAEVNESVNARVSWSGAGLSLLRDFPDATLSLDRLAVVGVAPFAGDTLLAMRSARLVLDLRSVLAHLTSGGRIVVREVALQEPRVRMLVHADGRKNWDIARGTAPSAAGGSREIGVTLRELRIDDGQVTLDDEQASLHAAVKGLHETLRGDFASRRFVLETRTRADTVSLQFAGVPYLTRVRIQLDAEVDADMGAGRFILRNDSLRLNGLVLAFAGSVTLGKPDLALDLTFAAPGTDFREILSLVPAIYTKDFAALRTSGTMSASGRVRGLYGPRAFPAFAVRARVEKGAFQYPALPLPARDIFVDLAIDNPGGHVDSTVVTLQRFHAVLGGRALDARMVMRTPVSDPDVDLRAVGSVNLADVARTVKLEGVKQLGGVVAADVSVRARLSDIDAARYDRVSASGTVNVSRLTLASAAIAHAVALDTAAVRLTPRAAELTAFSARAGGSDVRATGTLDNVLGWALRDDELRGTAAVASNRVNLDEWKSDEKITDVIPVPPRIDFTLSASAAQVTYGALTAANVRGGLRVKDQRVTLRELNMETLRGRVVANGYYDTHVPERPTFDVDLRLAAIDIPSAFAALVTVQKLAPVARWAQGAVSGGTTLTGVLGTDMMPVLSALTGAGSFETDRLVMRGSPVLGKVADVLKLEGLRSPSLGIVKGAYSIADGRLSVKPFVVSVGGMEMTVAGSNGIDQTLRYDLALAVPRALLGGSAGELVNGLAARAGQAGVGAATAEVVKLAALVGGTVTQPSVRANFAGTAGSVREAAKEAVQQQVAARVASVREKVDSAAEGARRRARAEAERLVAEAERQAASIREEARTLAAAARREGNERADSLLARATSPGAKMAAKLGTDRLRRESDQQADRIVREADARADGLVVEARRRAEALVPAQG